MVIIGLSSNIDVEGSRDCMPRDYISAVLRAKALPLILPMIPKDHPDFDSLLDAAINRVDALVFTGGPDIDPAHYNEDRLGACHRPVPSRDDIDLALMKKALELKKPFLAICRGLQVCNTVMGGSLYQDLPSQFGGEIAHQQNDVPLAHVAAMVPGTLLAQVVGGEDLMVTSRHHQSIKALAPGLRLSALAPDGVVEAVEFEDGRPALCLQWHPENLAGQDPRHQALFDWLVSQAGACS